MNGLNMLELFLSSTVLILGIAALRAVAGDWLSGRARYVLWLFAAVRLLLPALFLAVPSLEAGFRNGYGIMSLTGLDRIGVSEPAGAGGTAPDTPEAFPGGEKKNAGNPALGDSIWVEEPDPAADKVLYADGTGQPESDAVSETQESSQEKASGATWQTAAAGIWAGGAVLLAVWELSVNLYFYRRLRKSRKRFEQAEVPLKVYVTPVVSSPCQYGNSIYLPEGEAFGRGELRYILVHEYCHYRHRDFWWSALRCLLIAAWWIDPFVWLAAVLSKKDCELACDESVLGKLEKEERLGYGKTLIHLASGKKEKSGIFRAALSLSGSWSEVKSRIWRVAMGKKRFSGAISACVMALGLLLLAGCSFMGESKESGSAFLKGSLAEAVGETAAAEKKTKEPVRQPAIPPAEDVPEPEAIPGGEPIPSGEELWWFPKDGEKSYTTKLAQTEGAELWLNEDKDHGAYGELAVLSSDDYYYVIGNLAAPEEELEAEELSVSVTGELKKADYDGDGTLELAVAVRRRADAGVMMYSDVTRLFILEKMGDGWHPYEYLPEQYVEDWKQLLTPGSRNAEETRYDKLVNFYLGDDGIEFYSYSASWDEEYGYTAPDGGIMSWLEVRVEYEDHGGFSLSGPYAPEGSEGALEEYQALMGQ